MTIRTSRFRLTLAERGMTIAEVQRRSGLSPTTLAGCSRGMVPGEGARQAIASVLGCPVDWLWPVDPIAARAHG